MSIDVCNLLGKSLRSKAWLNLKSQVGDFIKEEEGSKTRPWYFSFNAGLHLEYDLTTNKFDGAWIYFTEHSGFGQFTGVLPFGLMCDDDRETVLSKLSRPPFQ